MNKYRVEEWFSFLPAEIRKKAIANTKKEMLDFLDTSILSAIMGSFIWHSSPEGHEYWHEIASKDWGTPQENKPKQ